MCGNSNRKPGVGQVGLEAEVFVAATRFADATLAEYNQLLSIWGMTPLQHNALSVLYVHDPLDEGLSGGEIASHLYTRVPDITRLLDRLAEKGWLTRERDPKNRRVVRSRLTSVGIELVESAHTSMRTLETDLLKHLSESDRLELKRLLDLALEKSSDD